MKLQPEWFIFTKEDFLLTTHRRCTSFQILSNKHLKDIRDTERELNIKFIRQNVQQLHKLSYSSNIDSISFPLFHEWNIIFNLLLNSVMKFKNIHKKHTLAHIYQTFQRAKLIWNHVQISVRQDGSKIRCKQIRPEWIKYPSPFILG